MLSRTMLLLVWTISVVLPRAATTQSEPWTVRYPLVVGERFVLAVNENLEVTQTVPAPVAPTAGSTSNQILQIWDVRERTASGDFVVGVRYVSQRLTWSLGPGVALTVDVRQSSRDSNPAILALGTRGEPILEELETIRTLFAECFHSRTFTYIVAPSGIVRSVTGFNDAWADYRLKVERLISDKVKRAALDAQIEGLFGGDAAAKLFTMSIFAPLPVAAVRTGHQWTDSTRFTFPAGEVAVRRSYKLVDIAAKGTQFVVDSTMTMEPPASSDDISYVLPVNKWSSRIIVNPQAGPYFNNSYSGAFRVQAFRGTPHNAQLISDVNTKANGSTSIAPVAAFVGELSYAADRNYLRGRYFVAGEFYDEILRVHTGPRFYFARGRSLALVADSLDAGNPLRRSFLKRAAGYLADASSGAAHTLADKVYAWMALTELEKLYGADRLAEPALRESTSRRLVELVGERSGSNRILAAVLNGPNEPDLGVVYFDIGNYLLSLKELELASTAYTRAVAVRPQFAFAYIGRGTVKEISGDQAGAETDYANAIKADPALPDGYLKRGTLRLFNGAPAALEDLRKGVELEPKDGIADVARLLIWLARARSGEKTVATAVLRDEASRRRTENADLWLLATADLLTGANSESKYFSIANADERPGRADRLSEAYLFAGALRLLQNSSVTAAGYFQKSIELGNAQHWAYRAAKSELSRLRSRKGESSRVVAATDPRPADRPHPGSAWRSRAQKREPSTPRKSASLVQ